MSGTSTEAHSQGARSPSLPFIQLDLTMDRTTLPLEIDKILGDCPQLRVLVVGKSGTGKSSLINCVFGIDKQVVSHQERGICRIEDEITSPQNSRLVLHDSMGFEPGQETNLQQAIDFLQGRSGDAVAIKDRVHVVWLCIRIPHAGGRVLETGDENLIQFALAGKIPMVVVFTQFDNLVSLAEQELTEEELDSVDIDNIISTKSEAAFKEICLVPLSRVENSDGIRCARTSGLAPPRRPDRAALKDLIDTTQDLVKGSAWFVSAMAQRASARAKIDASIEIGMRGYWDGLASTTKLLGSPLEMCLTTIHFEIATSWNFNDPDELLTGNAFEETLRSLVQFVVPEDSKLISWFNNLDPIQALIGLGTTIAATAAPVLAGIGLSAMFLKWFKSVYEQTPEALRCLMAYICDLTLIMDHLFLATLNLDPPHRLTLDHISGAVESYKKSGAAQVHTEVRKYANRATFTQLAYANKAEEKVKELINIYCAK